MKHRAINVTEFKAKCLALLDEVGKRGDTITITKRGQPLATVGPARQRARKSPEGTWAGRVVVKQDALDADTSGLWEVARQRPGARG